DCRRNVARTAEGGFATHSVVSKSAKVVLGAGNFFLFELPTTCFPDFPTAGWPPIGRGGRRSCERNAAPCVPNSSRRDTSGREIGSCGVIPMDSLMEKAIFAFDAEQPIIISKIHSANV